MTVVKAWVLTAAMAMTPLPALAQGPSRAPDDETVLARQKISIIEGGFERAVQNGVDNFSRRLRAAAPNSDGMAMLMGAPLVRGFRLEGQGIFFDVQMPSLQLSMVWPLRYAQGADAAAAALADFRTTLERTVTDPKVRIDLTEQLQQIERQMAFTSAARRRVAGASPVAAFQSAPPPAAAAPDDTAILDDPADAWRREVRRALIEAMIDNTGGVAIGPDEYLWVHARGVLNSDRLVADPGDTRTMELKLKGSDLAAYRAGTISIDDVRKRVQFREY